jgi:hypothetical protein
MMFGKVAPDWVRILCGEIFSRDIAGFHGRHPGLVSRLLCFVVSSFSGYLGRPLFDRPTTDSPVVFILCTAKNIAQWGLLQ